MRLGLPHRFLGREPFERRRGVGRKLALALEIGGKLVEPALQFGDALLGAGFLALESLARDDEPLQRRGRLGFGFAQGRQLGREWPAASRPPPDRRCARRPRVGPRPGALRLLDFGSRPDQAQMEQQRLSAAHMFGNVAVAHRLPRLGFSAAI